MRNLKIAYGNSCFAKKWSNKTITWDELCEKLKTSIRTTETVKEYPKLPKAERDRAKDVGGFVGGHLREGRRKRENVECRSMLALDADHATPGLLDELEMLCPYTAVVYSTHSHTPEAPRLRVIVPLARDVTTEEWNAISRYFAVEWDINCFDECSYRPHQLMYWPSSPSDGEFIYKRIDGEWLSPDKFLAEHPNWCDCSLLPTSKRESVVMEYTARKQQDPLAKSGVVGAFCRAYNIENTIAEFLSDVYAPSAMSGRYDYIPADSSAGVVIYDDKFAYSHHASDPACGHLLNAFDLVRVHKFGEIEDKESFNAMCEFASKCSRVNEELLKTKREQARLEFSEDEDWTNSLKRSKSGEVVNNLFNITLIIENDPNLKAVVFNQLADSLEIKGSVPWKHPARFWRDADDAQLVSYVDLNYGTFSARNYEIAVTKVTDDRAYHPIREYLDNLPPWDGKTRIETLLIDYLGTEDNKYTRAVTRKTLCAAVARVLKPGTKFDNVLVLNGPQGVGKSTLIAKLGGDWFSDSLSLTDMNDKTAAEKLQGYWLHEIGELAGMKKADIDKVKAFISRQDDKYRASFGRRVTPHPRQCVFFGTTNAEEGFLRDITGGRRFWMVKTPGGGSKHTWQLTEDDIKQIWSEALVYVKVGEKLFLETEVETLAETEQRDAIEHDDREGLVRAYLETLLPLGWNELEPASRHQYVCKPNELTQPKGEIKRHTVSNLEIWCECFGKQKEDIKAFDS